MLWGSALSIEGVDLAGASAHLNKAASLCAAQQDPTILAQTTFELGSIAAQQGDLARAIELYRRALAVGEAHPAAAHYRILAHNNLAYHLLLLGDPTAAEHAKAGLEIARESGVLSFEPYLLSTLGEIALADGDLDSAEASFNQGLDLAERLPIPERVAGLTANLGAGIDQTRPDRAGDPSALDRAGARRCAGHAPPGRPDPDLAGPAAAAGRGARHARRSARAGRKRQPHPSA